MQSSIDGMEPESRPSLLPGIESFRHESIPGSPGSSIDDLDLIGLDIPDILFTDLENPLLDAAVRSYGAELHPLDVMTAGPTAPQRRSLQTLNAPPPLGGPRTDVWCRNLTIHSPDLPVGNIVNALLGDDRESGIPKTTSPTNGIGIARRRLFHFQTSQSNAFTDQTRPQSLMSKPEVDPSHVLRSQVFIPRVPQETSVTLSPSPSNASDNSNASERDAFWSFDGSEFDFEQHSPMSPVIESDAEGLDDADDSSEMSMRKNSIPTKSKDAKYWRRRLRNNKSAKKSRDAKRAKELSVANRIDSLERENFHLKMLVERLVKERGNRPIEPNVLTDGLM